MSRRMRNQLILSLAVLGGLGALVLFTVLNRNDGSGPTAEAVLDESLRPGDGLCLKESVNAATVAVLVDGARAHARSAEVQAVQPGVEFGSVFISQEEAEAIIAFDARFAPVPEGWSAATTIVSDDPGTPVHGRCEIRTKLENPVVTREIVFPAHPLTLETGETVTSPEERYVVTQGARILVRLHRADEVEVVGAPAATSPESAEIASKPEEYSAGLYWVDAGLGIGVTCFVMTVDECRALAMSIK